MSVDARTRADESEVATETSVDELHRIVADACAAQDAVAGLPRADRAAALLAIADALEADRAGVVATADRETALGTTRLEGELSRTTGQFRLFAEVVADGAYREVIIDHETDAHPDLRRMLLPLGPVAVFGASNFPLAFSVPGGDTASALAAGCAVVVKAHPSHPATSIRCLAAIRAGLESVGLPRHTIGLVHGTAAGGALVEHPAITAVGFTGSLRGGRALFDMASSRPEPIPFYGELGSLNPVVIADSAAEQRGEQIARDFVASFTLGGGQFCTKPGLLFVPERSAAPIIEAIRSGVRAHEPAVLLNSSIASTYERRVEELAAAGATITSSSQGVTSGTANGATVVVVDGADLTDDRATELFEECFGPFTVVVTYRNHDELEANLQRVPKSLTATIQADDADHELGRRLIDVFEQRAGRLVWNGYPTGVAVEWSMHHGGPYPASTAPLHTSVGATAIRRWLRPVTYQNVPAGLLPADTADTSDIPRRIDGHLHTSERV